MVKACLTEGDGSMPFNAVWFDDLRAVKDVNITLGRLHHMGPGVPHLGDLRYAKQVTSYLYRESMAFATDLHQTPYDRFQDFPRCWAQHLANWPRGKVCQWQWNVGFSAGVTCADDHVRIGVGVRWYAGDFRNAAGWQEYRDFQHKVRQRPQAFDQLCQALGNYRECADLPTRAIYGQVLGPMSAWVLADQGSGDAWRFFGTRLLCSNPADAAIIGDPLRLVPYVVAVFDAMALAGFGA
jgi:hypothetical protein